MCSGHSPFRAETSFGVLKRICDDKPREIRHQNPEIPAFLGELVGQLHRKDPDQRIQSASEIEQLIAECLAHVEQPAIYSVPKSLRRSRTMDSLCRYWPIGPLLLLLFGATWMTGWPANEWDSQSAVGRGPLSTNVSNGNSSVPLQTAIGESQRDLVRDPSIGEEESRGDLQNATTQVDRVPKQSERIASDPIGLAPPPEQGTRRHQWDDGIDGMLWLTDQALRQLEESMTPKDLNGARSGESEESN